jgi:hypothetical protein
MKNSILKKAFSLALAVVLALILAVPAFAHGETNMEHTGTEPTHADFGHHWAAATLAKWSEFAPASLPHGFVPDAQATAADFAALLGVVTSKEITHEQGALTRGGAVKLIAAALEVSNENAQDLFIKGYNDGKSHLEDLLTLAQAITLADRVGTHISAGENAPAIEITGWIIDRDCLGVDAIKHTKGCNLMGGCLASGLGIFKYDPDSKTPTASSLSNYLVFDGAGKAKAETFLNSLPEDWKNNITVKATVQLVYNIPANADETNVPETELHAVDHYLIGVRVLTIEAAYIDGMSTNELPDGSNIQTQEIVTDYAGLWSSDNITVKVGVPVKWYVYANVGSLPTVGMACGKTIKIPGLGWGTNTYNKDEGHLTLTEGKKILVREFTPTKVGDILFTCWMGSECHGNYIHVTADGKLAPGTANSGSNQAQPGHTVTFSYDYKTVQGGGRKLHINGKATDVAPVIFERAGVKYVGFYLKSILEYGDLTKNDVVKIVLTEVNGGEPKEISVSRAFTDTDPASGLYSAFGTVDAPSERPFKVEVTLAGD